MLWPASVGAVTTRRHPHRMAATLLLVLLARQSTAEQTLRKRDAPPAGYPTNFSCVGRVAGYYADISSGCQLYHMCDLEGRRFTHACPNATLFQQRMMVCDHWYMVNCNKSELDYSANQLIGQRDKPFVSPEEQLQHREPVAFYTRQQSTGSLQQGGWFADVTDQKQKYPSAVGSIVTDTARLGDGGSEHHLSLDSIFEAQDLSTNRRERNRDSETTRSQQSSLQTSNAADSNSPVYFGTLPEAYTNNPFFQRLILRAKPSTSQKPTDNLMPPEPLNIKADQLTESKTYTDESYELDDTADARVSNTRDLPQQFSPSKSSDLAFRLGTPEVQNIPTSSAQEDLPETYLNNPSYQSLTKSGTLPLPISVIPPTIEQTSPKANIKFGENEDDFGNTVELHLLDHRRMFFIPDSNRDVDERYSYDLQTGNTTVLSIFVPEGVHVMHFRHNSEVTAGHNFGCPRCHPGFLVPGTCHPCVMIR